MGGWAVAQRRSPHEFQRKKIKDRMSKALFWERPLPLNAYAREGMRRCLDTTRKLRHILMNRCIRTARPSRIPREKNKKSMSRPVRTVV